MRVFIDDEAQDVVFERLYDTGRITEKNIYG